MPPLLPLAYDKSRIGELGDPHSVALATVDTDDASLIGSSQSKRTTENTSDLFENAQTFRAHQLPDSDIYSDPTALPHSSSSYLESDFQSHLEKIKNKDIYRTTNVIPSSPPMMPVSPLRKRQRRAQRTLFALGEELALDRDGKAFGIRLENDNFPPGYRPSLYDDPTFFVVDNPPEAIARASEAITRTFERDPNVEIYETYNLNLDGLQLKSLPEQINDFGHLVIYNKVGEITQPHLHLFASNNSLRSISPKIFDIGGLEGITLRDNKIARIPGAIGHAKSLRSINIAQNKIKFFPHTILNLPKLEIISVRPNKLIEIDDTKEVYRIDAKEGTPFNEPRRKRLRYVGKIRWITANKQISGTAVTAIKLSRNLSTLQDNSSFFNDESPTAEEEEQKYTKRRTFWCPRLSELVLRKISEYLISQSEVMKWRNTTHERVYKLAVKALIHGTNGEVCGYCENTVTEAVAELMEWWDLRDNSLLPIKRRFCCRRCAEMWLQSLPIEKNP